jgi:hypothetical protein
MKNTILISLLFCLFISQYFSQGLQCEIGINDVYKQEILHIANKNEFTYALVRYNYYSVYLEKFDTLGNRIHQKPVLLAIGFSSFSPKRMVMTNDENIWFAGKGI